MRRIRDQARCRGSTAVMRSGGLETAVDAIRRRHGENAIIRGNTGNPEIGLEGAWKRKEKARKEEKASRPQTAREQSPAEQLEPALPCSRSENSKEGEA